jgi:AraC-like DNA-binding protein
LPTVLVLSEDQGRKKELSKILRKNNNWELVDSDRKELSNKLDDIFHKHIDLHFIIYDKQLNKNSIGELGDIRKKMPFSSIIYYYSHLFDQQYRILARFEINSCIVGKHPENYLNELLPGFWKKHWKKIPSWIYPIDEIQLSTWAKDILSFIENHTLDIFNLGELSNKFHLSKTHFRSEFADNFGINFRDFKQKLFIHYETKLLVEKKYKPTEVYQVLNYSNLANFSRSFKSRHGESWRNYKFGDSDLSH